jgi:hypothetical protein
MVIVCPSLLSPPLPSSFSGVSQESGSSDKVYGRIFYPVCPSFLPFVLLCRLDERIDSLKKKNPAST